MRSERTMTYKVKIEHTDEGFAIWCPGLPGCWSQGTTEDEALANIRDAISQYLDAVDHLNEGAESRYVEVG
jgi:predicted RNase H-like HicB family nuclease